MRWFLATRCTKQIAQQRALVSEVLSRSCEGSDLVAQIGETLFAGRACNEFLQDVPLIGQLPLFIARVFFLANACRTRGEAARGHFEPHVPVKRSGVGLGLGLGLGLALGLGLGGVYAGTWDKSVPKRPARIRCRPVLQIGAPVYVTPCIKAHLAHFLLETV